MVWVKLDCPRCKAQASIDAKLAGQYALCPACQARVLVPINAPATDIPPGNPGQQSSATAGSATAAGGAANLRSTVQGGATQTWASGQPLPAAPGLGNGSPGGNGLPGGSAQPVRPAAQPMRPVGQPAPVPGMPGDAFPMSPPLADVPMLPPRADARPAGPPAVQPAYPSQVARPASGGRPPLAGGGMQPVAIPVAPAATGLAAPPMPRGIVPPVAVPPAPAAIVPAASRKVARFIAADPSQATFQLAADGQLPNLQLIEAGKTVTETTKGSSMNPLLVLAAIAASFFMSVMMLVTDFGSSGTEVRLNDARQQLETYYKGQRGPLAPYQIHLREAQQAYSRGALKTARNQYRKVLDALHAEGGDRFHGLTGTPASDKRLEELLSMLLDQDGSSGLLIDEP
jgi:hypothetical protein